MAAVEGGNHYRAGGVVLTPVMGLEYADINMPGFTESGANALNLIVSSDSTNALDPPRSRWQRRD